MFSRQGVMGAATGSLLVYQIELTNICNAACAYCPQPGHGRPRGFMSLETFAEALRAMRNRCVSLHHFGEPLLHSGLEGFVSAAASGGFDVGFSTNGLGLDQRRLDRLRECGLSWLRLHTDPFGVRLSDFSVPAGLEFTEHRLLSGSDAPVKEMVSFSGFLGIPQPAQRECSYIVDGWRVVLWNGDLGLCCHDVEGSRSISLCRGCSGYVFGSPRDWGSYDGGGA